MVTRSIYVLSLLVCCFAFAAAAEGHVDVLAQHDTFSHKYFQKVAASNPSDANVVTSGASIYELLTLLYAASTGSSHDELKNALGAPEDENVLVSAVSSLKETIYYMSGVHLEDASAVFVSADLSDVTPYISSTSESLLIGLESITSAKSAGDYINAWSERETNDNIGEVLPSTSSGPSIVNAMFFEGEWGFDQSLTKERPFYVDDDTTINVQTLECTGSYLYGSSDEYDAQFLLLPNVADDAGARALFILPNDPDGLEDVLTVISETHDLREFTKSLTSRNITLRVPSFRIETTTDLTEVLPEVGVKHIFQPGKSGLTNLLNEGDGDTPVIMHGVQKIIFQFNDAGSSADSDTPKPTDVIEFNIDHPFLVKIIAHIEDSNGPVAFTLRVVDPSK